MRYAKLPELESTAIRRFDFFYNSAVMKRGGTHIYSDHYWRPEDKNIPVYRFYPDDGWKSRDIKFLPDMPDLENVCLRNNELLTDITPLSELTKIKILEIYNCPNIKDIKPLSSLVKLELLYVTHNNNYDYRDIASLRNLVNLPNLAEVDLTYSNIKDIAPLSRSNSIKYVKVFEHDVEAGIDNNIRSRFHRKGIYLDIFYDDR